MVKNADYFDVNSISENSSIGYIVEVDWEHPHELHILLAILDMLSDYCKKIADDYGIKVGDVMKLIPKGNKTNYIVHYKNLQLYLPLGMKLT